jgi:hypothetical protein
MKRSKSMAERSFCFEKEEKMCLRNNRNGLSMEMALVLTMIGIPSSGKNGLL